MKNRRNCVVVIALGHSYAHIVGADVGRSSRQLIIILWVAEILHCHITHAGNAGCRHNSRSLCVAVVGKVRRCIEDKVARGGICLRGIHRNITACLLLTVRIAGAGDGSTASRNTLGIDGQRISSIRADLVSLSAVLIGIQGHTASRAPLHLPVRGIVGFDGRSESDAAAHVDGLRRIGVESHARDGDGGKSLREVKCYFLHRVSTKSINIVI